MGAGGLGLLGEPTVGELGGGGTEPDDGGDVLDARSAASFLGAADQERGQAHPPSHQQRGRAFRAAQLVGGDRAQVGAEPGEVERDVTGRGARVDVDQHATGSGLGSQRRHRGLQRADLVVGELHGHQHGVGPQRGEQVVGVEAAVAVDPDDGELGVGSAARLEDRRVFDGGRHHVAARVGGAGHGAVHGRVHRLGPGGGEHDLPGTCAEQGRDPLPGVLDRDPGDPAVAVHPSRVGGMPPQVGEHRLEGGRAQRRGGGVVEVGPGHGQAQTRATQWSLPSGRLASKCGEVSP